MKSFVLLKVRSARATPTVRCDMTSFVHDYLAAIAPKFWSSRATLDDAFEAIRIWIAEMFE